MSFSSFESDYLSNFRIQFCIASGAKLCFAFVFLFTSFFIRHFEFRIFSFCFTKFFLQSSKKSVGGYLTDIYIYIYIYFQKLTNQVRGFFVPINTADMATHKLSYTKRYHPLKSQFVESFERFCF